MIQLLGRLFWGTGFCLQKEKLKLKLKENGQRADGWWWWWCGVARPALGGGHSTSGAPQVLKQAEEGSRPLPASCVVGYAGPQPAWPCPSAWMTRLTPTATHAQAWAVRETPRTRGDNRPGAGRCGLSYGCRPGRAARSTKIRRVGRGPATGGRLLIGCFWRARWSKWLRVAATITNHTGRRPLLVWYVSNAKPAKLDQTESARARKKEEEKKKRRDLATDKRALI